MLRSGAIWSGGTFVVGVEPDAATDCLRMYVGSRGQGIYALVENEEAKDELRRGWAQSFTGHLMVATPPVEALYSEAERP